MRHRENCEFPLQKETPVKISIAQMQFARLQRSKFTQTALLSTYEDAKLFSKRVHFSRAIQGANLLGSFRKKTPS